EFTGAWHELHQAFICNPHDIEGVKQTIMRAITAPGDERRRRMKAMRKRVADHDVQRWASRYLKALAAAPLKPHRLTRAGDEELREVERANRANLRASDRAAERIGG
ncbi:MAG TPA: trehalose-6-phosphate synthase, partial [Dermatophilaceae bacterium]